MDRGIPPRPLPGRGEVEEGVSRRTPTEVSVSDIYQRLRDRYSPEKGWGVVAELRNRLGLRSDRSIDFFAVQTWDSKSPFYVSVEIKVSKWDYDRELQNPSKRKVWEECSTEFWFAAPRGIIPVEELPEGAGLLETAGSILRAKRKAVQFRDHQPTEDIWTNVVRRLVENEVTLRSPNRAFAEFAGRPISIDDLRQLAEKTRKSETYEFNCRVRAEVEKRRKETIAWKEKEEAILAAARKLAHATTVEHRLIRADEVARIVERVAAEYEATTDRVTIARDLRRAASILDPEPA